MMAVVMVGSTDEKNGRNHPVLHDFLEMSSRGSPPAVWIAKRRSLEAAEVSASVGTSSAGGGQVLLSGSSVLGSEKQPNRFESFQFHGGKSDISGPEASISGTKRSTLDSAFMNLKREKMLLPVDSDSPERSYFMKMPRKEVVSERSRRPHDDEVAFTRQPPPWPTSTSLLLYPPVGGRLDSVVSKWERSMPMNAGTMVHYPSRFGQSNTCVNKLSSSYTFGDSNSGVPLISQATADEGSRTGTKGAGILKIINSSGNDGVRNSTGMLPCSITLKAGHQNTGPEPSIVQSRHVISPTSRQMTIFYAGQAHVFDDVHPNKADIIMALAGSSGGSWSTTYSGKSCIRPPVNEGKLLGVENEKCISNLPFSQDHGLGQIVRVPDMAPAGGPPRSLSCWRLTAESSGSKT